MQSSYDILVEQQHLKHDARRQLTLFLKGIGLSLDDCLGSPLQSAQVLLYLWHVSVAVCSGGMGGHFS